MKKIFIIVLFLSFLCCNKSYCQIKPEYLDLTLQANATTAFISNSFGGSLDLDLYHFGNKNITFYTGVRFGYDQYIYYDVGGGHRGPYIDYNLLGKFSVSSKLLECSYYLGLSHHKTKEWGIVKTSLEIKFKVYKNFAGLLLNPSYIGNGKNGDFMGGIGIFIGASTKEIKF